MSEGNGSERNGAKADADTSTAGTATDAAGADATAEKGANGGTGPTDGWAGEPSLIDFPATLDVKAMGLNEPDFEPLVCELVLPHVPERTLEGVTTRTSRGGKYLSVRVRFTASGKNQLETIYRGLRAEPRVLFTL